MRDCVVAAMQELSIICRAGPASIDTLLDSRERLFLRYSSDSQNEH